MFDKPITFKEADQALARRKDKTTYMKSREIALAWNADARSRAFFSARVANATILSEIHRRVESVVAGKGTDAQARALLQRYFIGEGADALAELGFAPQRDAKGVAQLASTARLKLIIDTNVTMAQEVGQYKQWAAQRDIYKYGIWKVGYAKEHRPEHLARDGKAYAFDHPIWTKSPPGGEFNCHCYRMLLREEDMAERGITPERPDIPFEPSSLGFNPARGIRKPPEFGKRVKKEYKDKAKEQMAQFKPEEETTPIVPVLTSEEHAAKRQEQWNTAYEKRLTKWKTELVNAGADNAVAEELAKLYTPEAAKIGKPPKIVVDTLFSGVFLSKDATELVISGSLSDKKVVASALKAVKDLPHNLIRGKQWIIAKQHRTEREAKMLGARLIQGKHTWKQDLEATNPNYKTGAYEWINNCQRDIAAYEARRRGIDVVARPLLVRDLKKDTVAPVWTSVYKRPKIISCAAGTGEKSYNRLHKAIAKMPPGARCAVYVQWEKQGAHVFIAERRKDIIALIDPQSNKEYTPDVFKNVTGKHVIALRLDNKKFTDTVKLCAKEREE